MRPTTARLGLLVAILAAFAAALAAWHFLTRDPTAPSSTSSTDGSRGPDLARTRAASPGAGRRRLAPGGREDAFTIHVVDHATGEPVADGEAIRLPDPSVRFVPRPWQVLAATDAQGRIRLGSSADVGRLGIHAPGYVLAAVPVPHERDVTVRLRRGHGLGVRVVDETGAPRSGATALLASAAIGDLSAYRGAGLGHPQNPAPVWVATAGPDGLARFEGVPAGGYRLYVAAEAACPREGTRSVRVPGPDAVVVVRELQGIVAAIPGNPRVLRRRFLVDDPARLARSACVTTRIRSVRAALRRRFPGCLVFVHLPAHPFAAERVRVLATAADGTEWEVFWALQPVSTIREPVFLSPRGVHTMGRLRVMVVHQGAELHGVPVAAEGVGHAGSHELVSGSTYDVAAGRYRISASYRAPWLESVLGDVEVEVPPGGSKTAVARIALPQPLSKVLVEPRLGDGGRDVSIHVALRDPRSGRSSVVANWRPGRGPISFWAPRGRLELEASASGYEAVRRTIDSAHAPAPAEMRVAVVLRRSKPR